MGLKLFSLINFFYTQLHWFYSDSFQNSYNFIKFLQILINEGTCTSHINVVLLPQFPQTALCFPTENLVLPQVYVLQISHLCPQQLLYRFLCQKVSRQYQCLHPSSFNLTQHTLQLLVCQPHSHEFHNFYPLPIYVLQVTLEIYVLQTLIRNQLDTFVADTCVLNRLVDFLSHDALKHRIHWLLVFQKWIYVIFQFVHSAVENFLLFELLTVL